MKKDCKRLLGLVLALCMLISIVPAVAAEETQPADTNIYTPDFSTAVDGQLMEGWGVHTNQGLWGEKEDEGEIPMYASIDAWEAVRDAAIVETGDSKHQEPGLVLDYSEDSALISYKSGTSPRPYPGLYYKLGESYNAVSLTYTHIARDASKLNSMLMPAYFDESLTSGNRLSDFPLQADIYGDKLTVYWNGTALVSELDVDWRNSGKKVQIIAYSNPANGGYDVGFAMYIADEYICGGTTWMESFGGFNAICAGVYYKENSEFTVKNLSLDEMDLDSLGVYNLDNPVEKLGYLPDVYYKDPLHTVVSDATSGYAFVSWKVDETVLYVPTFENAKDGELADGWALSCGDLGWEKNTWYELDIYPSVTEADIAAQMMGITYGENAMSIYCRKYTSRKYTAGMYYQLDDTYDTISISFDYTAGQYSKMGNLLKPGYYDAETQTFNTEFPLTTSVTNGVLTVTWDGTTFDTVSLLKNKAVNVNIQTVGFSKEVDGGKLIGFAMYIDGVYSFGGTKLVESFPGFNVARMSFMSSQNCSLTMDDIIVRSMDVDSFGVYNLDAPAENYGYVSDQLYADPLHTVASDATTGYVFTTWKEDASFIKRFDFSADTDGTLPAGWELSMGDMAWDDSLFTMPLYATDTAWSDAATASGATNEPGLVLSYKGTEMYMSYKIRSFERYHTGLYYQFDDTYESMTVSYIHTADNASKINQFLMPVYFDAETGTFTKIPLSISASGTYTVSWNGESDATLVAATFVEGAQVKIYTYSKDAEGGKEIGYKLYVAGNLVCENSTVVESFPGFNAINVRVTANRNCTATMDNIVVSADVARIGDTFYTSVEDAAAAAQAGDTLELLKDSKDTIHVAADMTIDMNGHNLGGAVIADGVTLSGYDSANNDYSTYGTIASVSGNVASAATVDGRNYLAIADGNGGVSFHRYYLKTIATVLRVEKAAPNLYYQYALAGDEAVLKVIDSCGVAYWLGEDEETVLAQTVLPEGAYSSAAATGAAAGQLYTADGSVITGLTTDHVQTNISGRAYIKVGDTVIFSDNCLSNTLGESIEIADSLWNTLLVKQKNALGKLYEAFADVMSGLTINNYAPDAEAVLASFQGDLAQEQSNLTVQTSGWTNTENEATNGDFSNGITGWTVHKSSVVEAVTEDGNSVLSLSRVTYEDGTTSTDSPFVAQSAELVPGSRCDVSFRYKVVSVAEGGSVSPIMSVRWIVDGTETVKDIAPYERVANGEWGTASGYVFIPENAEGLGIRVRARTSYDCQVYFDDVVVQTERVAIDMQNVFFYTDSYGKNTDLTATVYGADYANITFRVFDGTEEIWASDAIAVTDGKASAPFALSKMTKLGEPYTVVATATDASGDVAYVRTQNIYMYHRPTHLAADGTFLKDGKPFYPVFGYGVNNSDIKSTEIALENAISVARIGTFTTADSAVVALDALQAKGMMGMICMHPGMYTAGSSKNMEKTLAVMGDPRVYNHPALFGYCVEDEAFVNYNGGDPLYDFENAYRLIRKLDGKHLIMATENYSSHYADTSKYLDALITDIYCNAIEQKVYTGNAAASQATDKPVYALTYSYVRDGAWPTVNDMRNNNYQALLGGATGLGYYKFDKANGSSGDIWTDAGDNGTGGNPELWAAIQQFYLNESKLLMEHFNAVDYETIQENLVKEDTYWRYSFTSNGNSYVILLGMMDAANSVNVALGTNCSVSVIAGTASQPVNTDGEVSITVTGIEAILCQIIPSA